MRRPSSAHSSGVVRISVTVGLCTYRFRRGTPPARSRAAEVDHVERAERDHLRQAELPAASSRSGPAESTPPTRSSASSVVVASSTPARKPPRASASIDCPGSGRMEDEHLVAELLEPLARAVTHGVVTPNIVAPINGRSPSAAGTVAFAMPAIAPAALAMICAEIWLTPEMSTTE